MSEPLNDIDKFFLDNIEPLEETPPAKVWQNIEAGLDKGSAEEFKKRAVFFKRLSAVLLVLLLAGGVYEVINKSKKEKNITVSPASDNVVKNSGDSGRNQLPDATNGTVPLNKEMADSASRTKSTVASPLQTVNPGNNVKGPAGNRKMLVAAITPTKENRDVKKDIVQNYEQRPINAAGKTQYPVIAGTDNYLPPVNNHPAAGTKAVTPGAAIQELAPAEKTKPGVDSIKNTMVSVVKNKKKGSGNFLSKISLTGFFSPQMDGYGLRDDDDHGPGRNDDDDKDKIREREKHSFSYTTGVTFNYQASKKWVIQSGLYLSKTSIDVKPTVLYANTDNTGKVQYRYNSSSGYAYVLPSFNSAPSVGDSCLTGNSVNSLQYIGIPFNVAYSIKIKKWIIQPTIGLAANFLVHSSIETQLKNGTEQETKNITNIQGLRRVYFNVMAAAEVQYPLSQKLSLSFSPVARLALTSINKNNVVKSFTNSIGSAIGINYKF